MVTLFHYPLCPASRAVRLGLAETGVEVRLSEVKPWAIDRAFLDLNPAGAPPVLTIEGQSLCGVYPIVEYLAEAAARERRAAQRLAIWPGTPLQRAEYRRVADWFMKKFHAEVADYLLEEKVYKPFSKASFSPDLNGIRAARANLRYHLSYLSFLSEHRKWLGGDHMSFADLAAAAQISVMDYLAEINWPEFPEAKSWYARMKSRPSFRPLLADRVAGLSPPQFYANLDF